MPLAEFSNMSLRTLFAHNLASARAWERVLLRWDDGEFSMLQPMLPDMSVLCIAVFGIFSATLGATEIKLQGDSVATNHEAWAKGMMATHADVLATEGDGAST